MEAFAGIAYGLSVALTPGNLLYCLVGATLGTLVGVLPGIGPVTTIAMLLPLTFQMSPTGAIIMLSGIFYGAHHAGSTAAIMLNMPGEPASVVICFDGHPLAKAGRAGAALCIAAFSSFTAGCIAVVIIGFLSAPLSETALAFGAPEYASAIALALVTACLISGRALLPNLAMCVLGLLIGAVGTDPAFGTQRFTGGSPNLMEGVGVDVIAVGLFAFSEIASELATNRTGIGAVSSKVTGLLPTWADIKIAFFPTLRGTALGAVLGLITGTGQLIGSFGAYAIEKKIARDPSRFGKGAIEGVAAPEAAANAAALTHFIPMLGLGIPSGAALALILSAMMVHGIFPGAGFVTKHYDIFWGLIASMWIGNAMLLVLNLPLIGIWIKLLTVPARFLYPGIVCLCCVGIYSVSNSTFDVFLTAFFGLVGFFFAYLNCNPAPLILGVVLGPIFEEKMRRSLMLSRGDPMIFLEHPISLALLIILVLVVVLLLWTGPRAQAAADAEATE